MASTLRMRTTISPQQWTFNWGGGGESTPYIAYAWRLHPKTAGYSTNFYMGRQLCPSVQPLPFYILFLPRKGTSFVYLLLTNGSLSPTYLELCIPFNCCKYTVSKIWINHKTRTFSWLFHCHKIDLLALFMHQNNRFPYPIIYFNLWNVYPFIVSYTWSPKKVPLLSLVLRAVGYFGSFITLCQLAMLDPHLEIRGALSP